MIDKFYNQAFPAADIDEDYKIRAQIPEDAVPFFNYYNDPEVSRYILATPPTTMEDAHSEIEYGQSLFKNHRGIYWSLAKKSDNQMIGTLGFYINNYHHRAELFYEMDKAYWRQGIMSRAVKKILDIGFNYIGLHRIEAVSLKANVASYSLLEKLGFTRDGTMRNYRFHKGKPHTVEMYSLIIDLPPSEQVFS